MDIQLKDAANKAVDQQRPIDLTRRIFIPIEKRQSDGTVVFKTLDHTQYQRCEDGSIRRIHPKVNGKQAKKLRRNSTRLRRAAQEGS
jgi:hypothetical protein